MKLSIITINLNNLTGLQKTVESVLGQTWRDFEYIVIDGGSTDGSAKYLEQVSKDLIWWVSENDRGIYQAMNKGIEKATGEYLLFLNSGDYLASSQILEKVQDELSGEGIIYGNLILLSSDGRMETRVYPDIPDNFFVYEESLPHPSSFIKRNLFELLGNYNEDAKNTSDWQFFMKALFEFGTEYKHLNLGITVFNLYGISSNPDNIGLSNREKENFIIQNPKVITADFFRSVDEARNILKSLRHSRTIKLIFSLGLLKYLKNYLAKRK